MKKKTFHCKKKQKQRKNRQKMTKIKKHVKKDRIVLYFRMGNALV